MGLDVNLLRQQARGAMYVAPERICVTADGEVCGEDDPRAVRLLVAKGCEIPAAEAAQYGLIADPAEPAPPAVSEEETAESPKRKK